MEAVGCLIWGFGQI